VSEIVKLRLELWVHGHYQDPSQPVEVDFFSVSGREVPFRLLDIIGSDFYRLESVEMFSQVPTDEIIFVDVEYTYDRDEDDWTGKVVGVVKETTKSRGES